MDWTENFPPNSDSSYDHCVSKTPIGDALIEWKSWKKYDDYCVNFNDDFVGSFYTLEEAKEETEKYYSNLVNECIIKSLPDHRTNHNNLIKSLLEVKPNESMLSGCCDFTEEFINPDGPAAVREINSLLMTVYYSVAVIGNFIDSLDEDIDKSEVLSILEIMKKI